MDRSGSAPEHRVVLVTAPDVGSAQRIAHSLVEEGLAACVNVIPGLTSIYRWRGKLEESSEVLLIVKTTSTAVGRLIERVRALHPYEVPEIISVAVAEGLPDY
ncbi:MAG: divalent-cation tolerance protein CutA, partial [Conexivisphaera sp.]